VRTITFLVYIDACRYDYITRENTPFLYELAKEGVFRRVETVPGFTQEAAMMTGKYPDETGFFTWYRYAPSSSPFLWLRPFGFLGFLREFRFYYPIKVGVRKVTSLITNREYQDPAFVPLRVLPYFENISALLPQGLPNLASLCRLAKYDCFEQTVVYGYIGSKTCGALFDPIVKSVESKHPSDLYIIHVGDLDGVGHKFGPHPELFQQSLRGIDSWISKTYRVARRSFNCNFIVTSDHGMFEVESGIDVEDRLRHLPLKVPDDYIYFLDSTVARFWFSNERAGRLVTEQLSRIPNGHILTQDEKERLHINFKENTYGELFFWLDKGSLIFPSFFQSIATEKTNGMHGYLGDSEGALIVYSEENNVGEFTKKDVIPLTDVFCITRALAGF